MTEAFGTPEVLKHVPSMKRFNAADFRRVWRRLKKMRATLGPETEVAISASCAESTINVMERFVRWGLAERGGSDGRSTQL